MVTRKSNTRALPVKTRVLLSYLAILVIPVAVATSLALQWITSSEIARIRRTLEDVSERIALSIETELRELESYVILTADSRMMTKLLYMPGDRLLLERFDNLTMLSDYLHQLTAYAATKEISSNLHVVLNTKDVVLTSGPQIGTVRFLANRILGHEDVDYQWFETLLAERHMASIIYPVHSALRPDVFSMLFVLSWPRHGSMPVLGTFVFEVDVASLLTVANHGTARDGITVVLSYQPAVGEKPLVVTPGPAEDPSWFVLVDSADETSFLDTGPRFVHSRRSRFPALTVHLVGQKSILLSGLRSMRITVLLIAVAVLTVGVAMSEYFTGRNLKPLRQIVEWLTQMEPCADLTTNEYELIESSLRQMMAHERDLKSDIAARQPQLVGYLLKEIIESGEQVAPSCVAQLEQNGVHFRFKRFMCVVCIDHKNDGEFARLLSIQTGHGTSDYFLIDYPNHRCGLVNFTDIGYRSWLTSTLALERIHASGKNPRFGVGMSVERLSEIRESYHEALFVTDYQLVNGDTLAVAYEAVASDPSDFYYPIEEELAVGSCLRKGDLIGATGKLERCLETTCCDNNVSPNSLRNLYHSAYLTCLRTANELSLELELGRDFIELSEGKSPDAIKKIVTGTYALICRSVAWRRSAQSDLLRSRIMAYIEANSTNSGLSLVTLADHLSLSPSHVSRIIHRVCSDSFPNLLNCQRVETAKQLLRQECATIEWVARRAGYTNTTSFTRSFKRIVGLTPGQYRSIQAHESQAV